MKIGIITHLKHAIREPFAGGLEMHSFMLADGLRARGHQVTLFALPGSVPAECVAPVRLGPGPDFTAEHIAYRDLMISLRGRDFDIIHNNALHYLPVAMAGGLPMPMVTSLHTPPFWELEGSIRLHPSARHSYVAVSHAIGRAWSPVCRAARVISNGVDLRGFAFQPRAEEARYLFWSGRIVPEKGLHLAIKAARRAGVELWFAGPVSDAQYYRREVEPQLGPDIRYLGHLNHVKLAGVIGGAVAVLCTPMWDEPYGLVIAEALACGTPVAAFARGGVVELLDETCGILVPPGDVDALAAAAVAVAGLSRADCRRRAEFVADGGRMIAAYEALYREMIESPGQGPAAVDQLSAATDEAGLIARYHALLPSLLCRPPAVEHGLILGAVVDDPSS